MFDSSVMKKTENLRTGAPCPVCPSTWWQTFEFISSVLTKVIIILVAVLIFYVLVYRQFLRWRKHRSNSRRFVCCGTQTDDTEDESSNDEMRKGRHRDMAPEEMEGTVTGSYVGMTTGKDTGVQPNVPRTKYEAGMSEDEECEGELWDTCCYQGREAYLYVFTKELSPEEVVGFMREAGWALGRGPFVRETSEERSTSEEEATREVDVAGSGSTTATPSSQNSLDDATTDEEHEHTSEMSASRSPPSEARKDDFEQLNWEMAKLIEDLTRSVQLELWVNQARQFTELRRESSEVLRSDSSLGSRGRPAPSGPKPSGNSVQSQCQWMIPTPAPLRGAEETGHAGSGAETDGDQSVTGPGGMGSPLTEASSSAREAVGNPNSLWVYTQLGNGQAREVFPEVIDSDVRVGDSCDSEDGARRGSATGRNSMFTTAVVSHESSSPARLRGPSRSSGVEETHSRSNSLRSCTEITSVVNDGRKTIALMLQTENAPSPSETERTDSSCDEEFDRGSPSSGLQEEDFGKTVPQEKCYASDLEMGSASSSNCSTGGAGQVFENFARVAERLSRGSSVASEGRPPMEMEYSSSTSIGKITESATVCKDNSHEGAGHSLEESRAYNTPEYGFTVSQDGNAVVCSEAPRVCNISEASLHSKCDKLGFEPMGIMGIEVSMKDKTAPPKDSSTIANAATSVENELVTVRVNLEIKNSSAPPGKLVYKFAVETRVLASATGPQSGIYLNSSKEYTGTGANFLPSTVSIGTFEGKSNSVSSHIDNEQKSKLLTRDKGLNLSQFGDLLERRVVVSDCDLLSSNAPVSDSGDISTLRRTGGRPGQHPVSPMTSTESTSNLREVCALTRCGGLGGATRAHGLSSLGSDGPAPRAVLSSRHPDSFFSSGDPYHHPAHLPAGDGKEILTTNRDALKAARDTALKRRERRKQKCTSIQYVDETITRRRASLTVTPRSSCLSCSEDSHEPSLVEKHTVDTAGSDLVVFGDTETVIQYVNETTQADASILEPNGKEETSPNEIDVSTKDHVPGSSLE